ncbi:sensor histidine kinase [Luteimonas abyssi]|uniref:sensor histidine kinase n=1 Tax=Luteimonas abyssi TaxID=1247514 RepID=UPI000737C106|nr:sensor histidine kinase [Luteimonas abyssi]
MVEPASRVSIRRTLLVYLGLLVLVGGTVALLVVRSAAERAADRAYDHLLVASALSIAGSVARSEGAWLVDLPYASLDLLAMAPDDRVAYRVTDGHEATITGAPDLPPPPSRPAGQVPLLFDAVHGDEPMRFALVGGGEMAPGFDTRYWVQVGQTRLARDLLAADLVWRWAGMIVGLLVAALALAWLAVGRALRPLVRIERDLGRRAPSELGPLPSGAPRELARTVAAVDGFMARLQVAQTANRDFMADVAHQMRTPLAALRAQAELGLDDDDPAQRERSLQVVVRNAAAMSRLLGQLLSDAGVEHRARTSDAVTVELGALVTGAVEDVLPAALPRPALDIDIDAAPVRVSGDPVLLREAVKNLIDNAVRHGRPPIRIAIGATDAEAWIEVADRGPGIVPERFDAVFERFARQASGGEGAGLGLAIVRRVAERHRGTVVLRNRARGGLAVRLRIPAVLA